MTVLSAIIIGLLMGAVFGFALEKSRVFEPGQIVGQMQLKRFIMLKVFLTAVATGAIALGFLHGFGFIKLFPKPTLYEANILGGLLLGIGISLAGACPGTVLAQVGVGYKDALFTLLGGLLGALVFSYAEPTLRPLFLTGGPGKITLADMTGFPYWLLALMLAAVITVGLYFLEKKFPWKNDIGKNGDGIDA